MALNSTANALLTKLVPESDPRTVNEMVFGPWKKLIPWIPTIGPEVFHENYI